MMMLGGNNNQGSDSETSHVNMWRVIRKIALILMLVVNVALQVVAVEETRITEGQVPPPGKYPALGRLVRSSDDSSLCVLSILNRDWLLAPASCFASQYGPAKLEGLYIVVGDEIFNETEPYEQVLKVERFIVHHRHDGVKSSYNKQTGDDIAVVKVTPPIKFSNRVTATNLPTCKEFEPGIGTIVGYGSRNEPSGLVFNDRLMEITNKIISHEECRRYLKKIPLDDRVFCVQAMNDMSTCLGDWGAAFYRFKTDTHMVMHGFLSRGADNAYKCGASGNVSVFTRVSSYVGWIHRRISGCGNHPWYNDTETTD